MCLACEMDALWFAEMEAAALRAKAGAEGKPTPDQAAPLTAAVDAKPEPQPPFTSPFRCEETRSE
jgi:hypothetical protein